MPTAASTSGSSFRPSTKVVGSPPKPWSSLLLTAKSPVNCSPMVSRMELLTDEPSVETPMSSASPMPSAPAVSAVRLGLVAALRPAISPVTPRSAPSGLVSHRAIGRGEQRPEHDHRDEQADDAGPEPDGVARDAEQRADQRDHQEDATGDEPALG